MPSHAHLTPHILHTRVYFLLTIRPGHDSNIMSQRIYCNLNSFYLFWWRFHTLQQTSSRRNNVTGNPSTRQSLIFFSCVYSGAFWRCIAYGIKPVESGHGMASRCPVGNGAACWDLYVYYTL